jgi:hypothetical protein
MTLHPLDVALTGERVYAPNLLGKRVRHREYDIEGRLTGEVVYTRGTTWFEVDTNDGRFLWAIANVIKLGAIPIPAPRGSRLA